MSFDVARASERPVQTLHAAEIFHNKAGSIASACADAGDHELVVAMVTPDHALRGIWTVPRAELSHVIRHYEDDGWSLVFSPKTTILEIEERCLTLARLAFARWEVLRRWTSKHR